MSWRPSSGAAIAARRAALLMRIREYFDTRGVLAVDTPAMLRVAASDPQLHSYEVPLAAGGQRYLQTSPEACMKRLLADGYPDIYSIARVFRDAESGRRHQPEFTLLEWYRLGFGLDDITADTTALIAAAVGRPELGRDIRVIDYRDAFRELAGVDPLTDDVDALATVAGADAKLRRSVGEDRDDWLNLLLGTRVAGGFRADRLTVLRHFPAGQAALARLCPADAAVADRFEVFLGPLELANGYVELTDADEQRRRFEADRVRRRRAGLPVPDLDLDLIAALEAGLPECAGVAVGIERLQMVLEDCADIRDVVSFAFDDRDD